MKYQRIMVAGCSASGKSTFARELAEYTQLPLIHLDREYWLPGWVEPDKADWREKVSVLVERERWVMDGNYSGTWDLRLPRADLVIYLSYPLWLILWRATKRQFSFRGEVRPDMAPGCPERFNWEFYHFVILCYFTRKRNHLRRLSGWEGKPEVLIFRSPKQLKKWFGGGLQPILPGQG